MRIFVTGATGFIGGSLVRLLRSQGHDVVALVRSPAKAEPLAALGVELVAGDLHDAEVITQAAAGCDAAVHGAAIYEIGVTAERAEQLRRSNVDGTRTAVDALIDAGVPRIVYLSTVNVFGDTGGAVVDETYTRDVSRGFLSVYDETKYAAHQLVLDRIAAGAPIVVVQPSLVYGPKDHSEFGSALKRASRGTLPALPFGSMKVSVVHVDDVAQGIVLALDKGRIGESYVLSGDVVTMAEAVRQACAVTGRTPPRALPTAVLRAVAPFSRWIGPAVGMPVNVAELIRASDGVSYLSSYAKASRELGYSPRSFAEGLPTAL